MTHDTRHDIHENTKEFYYSYSLIVAKTLCNKIYGKRFGVLIQFFFIIIHSDIFVCAFGAHRSAVSFCLSVSFCARLSLRS